MQKRVAGPLFELATQSCARPKIVEALKRKTHTLHERCGYEVIASFIPVFLQLTEKDHPLTIPLEAQRWCHCWKHVSNSCCGISFSTVVTFIACFLFSEIFVPLGQTSFFGNSLKLFGCVGVPFQ